jgi:hypothetical protein
MAGQAGVSPGSRMGQSEIHSSYSMDMPIEGNLAPLGVSLLVRVSAGGKLQWGAGPLQHGEARQLIG